MNIIRIKLEYGCFPVWIYSENNNLIENDLPPYLIGDDEIDPIFVHIQKIYDSLYINDSKEFIYIGFKDEEMKVTFGKELSNAIEVLKRKLNKEYTFEENPEMLKKYLIN